MAELSQSSKCRISYSTSALTVLANVDFLPLMLKCLDRPDKLSLKLACKSTRQACDQLAKNIWLMDDENTSNDTILSALKAFVLRGCRPLGVAVCLRNESLESQQASLLSVLRETARITATQTRPLPTRVLMLSPMELLTQPIAEAVAATFPALEDISLCSCCEGEQGSPEAGLALLLGTARSSNESPAGRGPQPLLPFLTRVFIEESVHPSCGRGTLANLLGAMRGSQQLRDLTVHADSCVDGRLTQLSQLTQLRSLDVMQATCSDMRVFLPCLTGLTRLHLARVQKHGDDVLPVTLFTDLTALAHLTLENYSLDIRSVPQLTAPTHLSLRSLRYRPDQAAGAPVAPLTTLPSWQLPPQLRYLQITGMEQQVEVLGGLQLPECMETVALRSQITCFHLHSPLHATSRGRLHPAAHDALCRAAGLMARCSKGFRSDYGFELRVSFDDLCKKLLRPPRAVAGGGGGGGGSQRPRSHAAWLAALGGMDLMGLRLFNVRLKDEDLRCISKNLTRLEVLRFEANEPSFDVPSLPHLARLQRLSWLDVDARCLLAAPAGLAAEALLALCGATRAAELCVGLHRLEDLDEEGNGWFSAEYGMDELPRARELCAEVQGRLEEAGLEPCMVCLRDYDDDDDEYSSE